MSASLPAPATSRAAARDLRRLRILASLQTGLSYAAIGRAEGLSRERVRQIVAKALDEEGTGTSSTMRGCRSPGSSRRCASPRRPWPTATSARSTGCCGCSTASTDIAPSKAPRRARTRAGANGCSPSSMRWPSAWSRRGDRGSSTPTGGPVQVTAKPPLTRRKTLISLTIPPRRQAPDLTSLDKT